MDYSHFAILLLALGLALLVAEIFIPSGGMISVGSVLCFVIGTWCAWQAWGSSEQRTYFWIFIGAMVFLLPVVVSGTLYILPRTSMGKQILLEAPSPEELTPFAIEQQHLAQMVGRKGKTLTLLNPGGLVLVNGERLHCESQGIMVDPNVIVDVVAVRGNRLVVRLPQEESAHEESPEHEAASDGLPDEADLADTAQLDFDLPQS